MLYHVLSRELHLYLGRRPYEKNDLAVAALVLVAGFAVLSQTPTQPKYQVVFQLTEPAGAGLGYAAVHVTNMRNALAKDGVQVEVVFFGPGLNMLLKKNTAYEERLKQLADSGVTLAACQNAMKFLNVKTEDLFPFATQVDSGVAELAASRKPAGRTFTKTCRRLNASCKLRGALCLPDAC